MSCLKLLKQSLIRPLRSQYQDLDTMTENKKSPQIVATFAGKKSFQNFLDSEKQIWGGGGLLKGGGLLCEYF